MDTNDGVGFLACFSTYFSFCSSFICILVVTSKIISRFIVNLIQQSIVFTCFRCEFIEFKLASNPRGEYTFNNFNYYQRIHTFVEFDQTQLKKNIVIMTV